ncbi:DNA-binding CsgD family transcriptional regulator [Lipingzhangella halophila]|uniref:DNA-binding CsgD family transcriptional regulator n=1 Tax=Lipingzhangella halophila TaxID=1783352 RepID=A0A7W7W3G7_9ACTN|nr:LuxR family transcriptional regulator [Lipingzhangella halophila]MBB4932761.1 DNA-binding CsgD family transcriptional regulator [Lipingzhangella halophila]
MEAPLEQAREAYADFRWNDAYAQFRAAREAGGLGIDDLAALADAAWWLGRNDESLTLAEQVYRGHLQHEDAARAAQLAVEVGFLWLLRGEPTIGSGWISRATRLLDDVPECGAHGYLRYLEAAEALDQGRLADALDAAQYMRQVADRCDDRTLYAGGLVTEGIAVVKQGRVGAGLAVLDEAMLPVRAGEVAPKWVGNLYCQLMSLFIEMADVRRARDWTAATERWCDRHSSPAMFAGVCRVHRAQLLRLAGAWRDAEQHAAQACRDLADMNVGVVAEGHYVLGELCRLRDDLAGAQAAYDRADELGRDPQPGRALLRLAQGRGDAAARELRTALSGTDQPLGRAPLLSAQVDVAAATGDADLARRAAGELGDVADTYGTAGLVAAARQAGGTARLVMGEAERALPLLRDAMRRWRALDARYDAARVRCLLARALHALGDGDAAVRESATASAVFAELGAAGAAGDFVTPPEADAAGEGVLPGGLSPREAEVLTCVAAGLANRRIAGALAISERTVERHLANIFRKLGVASRTEAAGYAFEHGLVHPRGS